MAENLKKIMYIEDDMDIAELTKITLEDIGGMTVKHCPSGEEGLKELPKYNPQLVLLDVMMPGMDGPTVLKKMREDDKLKKIPVIFITAKAQVHEQKAYKNMGVIGVVMKPYDPMTLHKQLEELWRKNA
jgi:DNA-binding response OmpR family regulator